MAQSFDVIILGGGNAGFGVTIPTREAGMSVAMVEAGVLGGVCPNRGCTPKKVLVAAAKCLDEIGKASVHHITVGEARLDWAALIAREKRLIADIPSGLENELKERGVELIRGRGAFAGPNTVAIDGDRVLEARHIVIAAGSRPRTLPIEGAELMITSDEVLSEAEQPSSVVFIGGGVIAFEFSHIYARAGTKVTILELAPRLLPALDVDVVAQLRSASERLGITIETGIKVRRVERSGGGLRVVYETNGQERAIDATRVVNGAGRIADVEGLGLDAGGVKHEGGRIAVDPFLRSTSNAAVHVAGDALTGVPQLSPVATYEGRIVGRNIVEGPKHTPDYSAIPSGVYTIPAVASVGLTEAAAREKGLAFEVHSQDLAAWMASRTHGEATAFTKILVENGSDRILGAHIVGHAGEEVIHLFALAMANGITASTIREQIFAFPTFANDFKHVL